MPSTSPFSPGICTILCFMTVASPDTWPVFGEYTLFLFSAILSFRLTLFFVFDFWSHILKDRRDHDFLWPLCFPHLIYLVVLGRGAGAEAAGRTVEVEGKCSVLLPLCSLLPLRRLTDSVKEVQGSPRQKGCPPTKKQNKNKKNY